MSWKPVIIVNCMAIWIIATALGFDITQFEALFSHRNLESCKETAILMIKGQTQAEADSLAELSREYNASENIQLESGK
jgi:hypothetical protein